MSKTGEARYPMMYGNSPDDDGQWRFSPLDRFSYVKHGPEGRPIPAAVPFVTVKRRKDGKYVVVEKYPHRLKPVAPIKQEHAPWKLINFEDESEVQFRSIRPEWKYINTTNSAATQIGELPNSHLTWQSGAKIGSLDNCDHQPGGGTKRIVSNKLDWNASSKIGSFDNINYPIRTWRSQSDPSPQSSKNSSPRLNKIQYGAAANIGMLDNVHYTPGGAAVVKPRHNFQHVKSKIDSFEYINHVPKGGGKKIPSYKCDWESKPRVSSLENIDHKARGGDVLFLQERLSWSKKPKVGSLENINHQPGGGRVRIPHFKTEWKARPRVDSLANVHHTPRGGDFLVPSRKVKWTAESKVNSLPSIHKPPKPVEKSITELSYEYDSTY